MTLTSWILSIKSTAKHDVLNGEYLKTILSKEFLVVTKECKTDAQDLFAGFKAEQLLNKN